MQNLARCALIIGAAALFAGCGGSQSISTLPLSNRQAANPLGAGLMSSGRDNVIKHVVIIMQEGRSMDNLFYRYPNADTQPYGYNEKDQRIDLKPVGLQANWAVESDYSGFFTACNSHPRLPGKHCQMNGFDELKYSCGIGSFPKCPNAHPPYSYVPHKETKPYFAMARQYVLGDKMFASNFDFSDFISQQYIVAAQSARAVGYPDINGGCAGYRDTIETLYPDRKIDFRNLERVCFTYVSLGQELDAAKLSWRYYAPPTVERECASPDSPYGAIHDIYYGADWGKDIICPPTEFFKDVKAGKLPVVAWIAPTCKNSDRSGCGSESGPSWVASLVNAIGESKYWDSTAIFVLWSSAGGWYDHVPPPYVDYDGLGMRVPLLVISAYAKQGYVSHVRYEHGSILKFIEQRFDLSPMSASDTRANSPEADCFNFFQRPRKFTPIGR